MTNIYTEDQRSSWMVEDCVEAIYAL